MTTKPKIVIVGGGTAGWVTLAYIAAKLDVDITIVHSNEIDIIGVGESTSPTIRQIADAVGVNESTWMRDSRATFKYGIEFFDWQHNGSRWFHSFDSEIPHQAFSQPIIHFGKETYQQELTSIDYFLKLRQQDSRFDIDWYNRAHGPLQHLLDTETGHYNQFGQSNINQFPGYAYHVNAYDYSQCLRKHTPKEKYLEVVDTVIDVEENEEHGIRSVLTKSGLKITGDIFIDCTGFRRLLIGRYAKLVPFTDLPNDSAIFGSVNGFQSSRAITQAHAQDAGWIWSIPTWGRMGSGHVYCSKYMSDDLAYDTIVKFWADQGHTWTENNRVKFTGGRLSQLAIKNVVANGLGQSFIEPLEATSIMITAWSAIRFVEIFQRQNGWNTQASRTFSTIMTQFLENTKNFVKYHYQLSNRDDTEYWRNYKNPSAVTEVNNIIHEKLQLSWPLKGQTLINKFNWASMLIGYNKPYTNTLHDIDPVLLENYQSYVELLQQNYKFITRNNLPNSTILKQIHQ